MKSFGHTRPRRDANGEIIGSKLSPARARTIEPLGPAFGSDRHHRLIVSLEQCDMIVLRPEKTMRTVAITAADLYSYLLRCAANRVAFVKASERKEAKAERLASDRQSRAEKRLARRPA